MTTHNRCIDALRGVAIVLVMLLHFALAYGFRFALPAAIPPAVTHAILANGNYGVSMFFVVSGFLITANNRRRYGSFAAIDARDFYLRRLFRLVPLLVLMLVVVSALRFGGLPVFENQRAGVRMPGWFQLVAVFSVLTFWHNVLMEIVGGWFNYAMNICWSLSIEETFYLLLPLLLRAVRSTAVFAFVAAACLVCGPLYRGAHRDDELFYLYGNLACVDQITTGILAALVADRVRGWIAGRGLVAVLALGCVGWVYALGIAGHEAFGFSVLAIATGVFLVAVDDLRPGARTLRATGALAWLGRHSYELYLFHLIVLGLLKSVFSRQALDPAWKLPLLAVFLLLSIGVAAGAARSLGDPLNRRLRARFLAPRATARA